MKTIVFLENEVQVNECLSWINGIEGEKVIIALTPFAMHELENKGISYKIQEDYYDSRDLYSMGMDNFQKVENLCSIVDGYIFKSVPQARARKITPALFSFYHLKMMYDAMTVRIFQLSSILNEEKPDSVYFYKTEKYPFGSSNKAPFLQFDNKESIYSQLLVLPDWKINVKILHAGRKIDEEKAGKTKRFSSIYLKTYVSKHLHHPELMDLVLMMNSEGIVPGVFKWAGYKLKPGASHASVALLGGGYEWHESIVELRKRKIGPIYRLRFDLHQLFDQPDNDFPDLWEELLKNKDFSRFFIFKDIDFFKIIETRIQFLVRQVTTACLKTALDMEKMIKEYGFKAIISPEITTCIDHSAARAAHNNGIPVITWQYGAYGAMSHPLLNYTDLISSDFHFVYGKGVEEQYSEAAKTYGTSLISVGSATLDRLQEKYKSNSGSKAKKNVLYITNSYWQNSLYVSFYPVFSDNHFWRTQKTIVDTLGKFNEYSIIMKLHPSLIYMDPDIQSYAMNKGFKNFKIVKNEISTVELLLQADIIVIDLPSTTLLQALTTKKPVFIHMGHMRFDRAAYQQLENRAICSEKLEDFILKLDDYLKNGIFTKDVTNRDFLTLFGTCEGSAAARAADKLRKIIDTKVKR